MEAKMVKLLMDFYLVYCSQAQPPFTDTLIHFHQQQSSQTLAAEGLGVFNFVRISIQNITTESGTNINIMIWS